MTILSTSNKSVKILDKNPSSPHYNEHICTFEFIEQEIKNHRNECSENSYYLTLMNIKNETSYWIMLEYMTTQDSTEQWGVGGPRNSFNMKAHESANDLLVSNAGKTGANYFVIYNTITYP